MKKITSLKILVAAVISALVFTGCGHKENAILVQDKIETVYILPPKEVTEKIVIPEPISKEKYLSLNIKDREKELAIYTTKLISVINIENEKKEEVLNYINSLDKSKIKK